eukprot:2900572-Amphidinium_carterae.2
MASTSTIKSKRSTVSQHYQQEGKRTKRVLNEWEAGWADNARAHRHDARRREHAKLKLEGCPPLMSS